MSITEFKYGAKCSTDVFDTDESAFYVCRIVLQYPGFGNPFFTKKTFAIVKIISLPLFLVAVTSLKTFDKYLTLNNLSLY